MNLKEWVVLVPKGAISYSVAISKPVESRIDLVVEPEYPDPIELSYDIVTIYRDATGKFPPLECNGRIILVREAENVPPPAP